MEKLLEDIKALPVTHKAENTWVDKKYKPVTIRLVELDKVIELVIKAMAQEDNNIK